MTKIVLFLLLFSGIQGSNWIDETNNLVETIRKESKLLKTKTKSNESESYTIEKSKYLKYNFNKVAGKDKWKDTFNFSFYSKKGFVFSSHYFFQADFIFVKGVQKEDSPIGEITEYKVLFKDKQEGVCYNRSIHYTAKSNRDSLVKILQNMPFDTLKIGNIEYLRSERMYKLYK